MVESIHKHNASWLEPRNLVAATSGLTAEAPEKDERMARRRKRMAPDLIKGIYTVMSLLNPDIIQ